MNIVIGNSQTNRYIDKIISARERFFAWRGECGYIHKLNMALIVACTTGLSAQIRIYTSFTPVPITAQVFVVLLSAAVLGKWWGMISQSLYVGIGMLGIPWFAPGAGMGAFSRGGYNVIFGATGGYLIGFIAAAFVIGYLIDARRLHGGSTLSSKTGIVLPAMFFGVLLIHLFGTMWLIVIMEHGAAGTGAAAALTALVLFLPLDVAKAAFASMVGLLLLPDHIQQHK